MNYDDKPKAKELHTECTLPKHLLEWFRDKKPNLMPHGGWDRLKQLEAAEKLNRIEMQY